MENTNDNQYTDFSLFYDDIMLGGYYDYVEQAATLQKLISKDEKILELGVGTGLLVEKLVACDYDVTGIDHTPAMLEIAKTRLGDAVPLHDVDVRTMKLGQKFDCAVSNGGVWYCVFDEEQGTYRFCGHLIRSDDISSSLKSVSDHLNTRSKLILSIQPTHKSYSVQLADGSEYRQIISKIEKDVIKKEYLHTINGETHKEELFLRYIDRDIFEAELKHHGFCIQNEKQNSKYMVFSRPGAKK
jgi:SAM-dependent methyltransferase